jgi:signal transduction histidine kinase/DNA-binding NarL/FixJ family response regulator
VDTVEFNESIELSYLGLVRLSGSLARASDWSHVADSVSESIGPPDTQRPARLWGRTQEQFEELARSPEDHDFPRIAARDLDLAAERTEATVQEDGAVLVGLHAGGVSLGVLEVRNAADRVDFLSHVAAIVACHVGLLAAQGMGNMVLAPLPIDAASDTSAVMSGFASEAKRMLDHDRLSAYLISDDGRSFERFAVATSPIIPGEGLVMPFEDNGLRHIVATNRPLVSEDLGRDPRIVGREDRIIAAAGFRGLVSVPLRLKGRPIGVLNFVSRTPGFYREQDIPVAQQIADQISVFLENLRRQRGMRDAIQREATERERARLTGDLYRAVSDSVLAIGEVGKRLTDHLKRRDPWAAGQAESLVELARLELADVRRAVSDMSPVALESHTLEEVVESRIARLRRDGDTDIIAIFSGDTSTLPPAVTRASYYIVQEALVNIRQHAQATRVKVEIRSDGDLSITVQDNGVGFEEGRPVAHQCFGLAGMLERAQALGGSLSVQSEPGAGATVQFNLPLSRQPQIPASVASLGPPGFPGGALRILVADALPATRAGLTAMLEGGGGIRVVGTASSTHELEGLTGRLRPEVILLDARLAASRPLEVVQRLVRGSPTSRVLLIVSPPFTPQQACLEAGARGSVRMDIDASGLVEAVRAVVGGAIVLASAQNQRDRRDPIGMALGGRELEILSLIAAGQTNTEIGATLFLASKTIERHVATIVGKLGARNRAHAAALAVAEGLVVFADREGEAR